MAATGLIAAVVALGLFGSPSASPASSSSSPTEAASQPATIVPGSAGIGASRGPEGSPPPAAALKFDITLGGTTVSTDSTTTSTACTRDPANPRSLHVDYSSSFSDKTQFAMVIDDTSVSPPHLSKADITFGFSSLGKTLTVTAADVSMVSVVDNGDHASIALAAASRGNSLTGTITCNVIGP